MFLPWVLCGILLIIILALCAKLWLLQKSMDEICTELMEHLSQDTNTLLLISSRDRHVRRLAAELNGAAPPAPQTAAAVLEWRP